MLSHTDAHIVHQSHERPVPDTDETVPRARKKRCVAASRVDTVPQGDVWGTPEEAMIMLLLDLPQAIRPSFDRPLTVWDPFSGTGENVVAKMARIMGFRVIQSNILIDKAFACDVQQGKDFFGTEITDSGHMVALVPRDRYGDPIHFDGILTHPAYSQKDKFLQRVQLHVKANPKLFFAALLPLMLLEGLGRMDVIQSLQMSTRIIPNRINFKVGRELVNGGLRAQPSSSMPFNTSWFVRYPGEECKLGYLHGRCTQLQFSIAPHILMAAFRRTRLRTVLDLGREHVSIYRPGMCLDDRGRLRVAPVDPDAESESNSLFASPVASPPTSPRP